MLKIAIGWQFFYSHVLINLSQDSKLIATFNPDDYHNYHKTVKLWDTSSGRPISKFRTNYNKITSVSFSPDRKIVAIDGNDNYSHYIQLWDVNSGKLIRKLTGEFSKVNSVIFSPDCKIIAAACDSNSIYFWDSASGTLIPTFEKLSVPINNICFSPNGKLIASTSNEILANKTHDNTIKLWDAASRELVRTLEGHSGKVNSIDLSSDGKIIASASDDNTVKLWNAKTGQLIQSLSGDSIWFHSIHSVSFSPDGKIIAAACHDNVKLWDSVSGRLIRSVDFSWFHFVNVVSFSPDGNKIATAKYDIINLWDIVSGNLIHAFIGHSDKVTSIIFSPDGKIILSASDDNTLKIWDTASGKLIKTFKKHSDRINSVAFSPDCKIIISTSNDETVKLWDTASGKLIRTLKSCAFGSVCFSPDSKVIALALGKYIILLDANLITLFSNNKIVSSNNNFNFASKIFFPNDTLVNVIDFIEGHYNKINCVRFSPNGNIIVTASGEEETFLYKYQDNTIKLWDATSGKLVQTLEGHSKSVNSASFSPDSKIIAAASDDYTIKLWDVASGKSIQILNEYIGKLKSVSFSPVDQIIACVSDNNTVKLWDVTSGQLIRTFSVDSIGYDLIYSVIFSPNGKILAAVCLDKVKLIDSASGKLLRILEGDSVRFYDVIPVSFAPNDNMIVTAKHNKISLWDSVSITPIKTFEGHSEKVNSVSFSLHGKIIASASDDSTVKLWDVITGKLLQTLNGHLGAVNSISFSSNGTIIVSGGSDQQIKFWEVRTGKNILTISCLDETEWIAWTPEGYNVCSVNASRYLSWSLINGETCSFEKYEKLFYRPDLIQLALSVNRPESSEIMIDNNTPPHLEFIDLPREVKQKRITFKLAYEGASGFRELTILLNGQPVKNYQAHFNVDSTKAIFSAKIQLVSNYPNNITAIAHDDKHLHTVEVREVFATIPDDENTELFSISLPFDFSKLEKIMIDGKSFPELKFEKKGNMIRFRGSRNLFELVSKGLIEFSVWLDGIKRQFYLWKGQKEILHWKKETFGENYALIIGISQYGTDLSSLFDIQKQAKELGSILEKNNFKVTYLIDSQKIVNKDSVENTWKSINRKMNSEKDQLFFYFGGHGIAKKNPTGDSTAYLILNDYNLNDLEGTCLSMDEIYKGKFMQQTNAKHILFTIDACVAGIGQPMKVYDSAFLKLFRDLNYIYNLKKEPGRTVITAGSGAQEVLDIKGKGGIFTSELINALKGDADFKEGNKDGILTIDELKIYLKKYVNSESILRNWPQEPNVFQYKKGEFVFYHYQRINE